MKKIAGSHSHHYISTKALAVRRLARNKILPVLNIVKGVTLNARTASVEYRYNKKILQCALFLLHPNTHVK